MMRSPLLKYVAGPQTFAYMPPLLGAISLGGGIFLWFVGTAIGFGPIPGIFLGIGASIYSVIQGFREPHLHSMLLARQKFMRSTPGIIKTKGKTYVG